MNRILAASIRLLLLASAMSFALVASAAPATFFRAINLNGSALTIDGNAWEGQEAKNFSASGKTFENQNIPLKPPTDSARTQMIRSSRWGDKVDLTLSNVPPGAYQIFLFVWEDNHSEKFSLLVNDRVVVEEFHSGTAGMWRKLGPWRAESVDGKLNVSARAASHGAANLSGLEVWSGDGEIPVTDRMEFVNAPTSDQVAFFESKIRPLLIERCYECHSASAKKLRGGLLLDSRAGVIKGGDTGPAITPGDPEASLLIQAVRHASEDLAMPPKKKLPPEEIAALEEWVRMGAPDPRTADTVASVKAKESIDWNKAREWWSFRPLAAPRVPSVKLKRWPANDLDRFILVRLEAAGIKPAPDADRRVLIRRATFDLIGLPPTPEEVEAFLDDKSPNAFAKIVDRLLASPHYGERWGRYWLDVVRYADTAGDNSDFPIPQMHRYRDWVIRAFNRDLPYDQFVREQLAGDLLVAATPSSQNDTTAAPRGSLQDEQLQRIIATGYIANSRRFGSRVEDYPQHLTIEDTLDNLGRAFLGLTINCARCHDHKFDPITTQDYYALYGIFHSTRYPWPGIELEQKQRDLVPLVPRDQIAAALKAQSERDAEHRRLEKEVKRLEDDLKNKQGDEKKKLEEAIAQARDAAKKHAQQKPLYELAYAVADAKKIEDAQVQFKGDPAKPGEKVPRRFLTVLGGSSLPPDDKTSGRQRLADWLVDKNNSLAARVMVNRIWLHHFGKGLVPTPNDFGKQGKPPTHPELLDWLASRFIAEGWSVKAMHRVIMLSHTYQQSSASVFSESVSSVQSGQRARTDSLNTGSLNTDYFSPFPRRRLDAEAIRDTLLALGGNLDTSPAGPHPFPPQTEWKFTQHNPFKAVYDSKKRSVYLMTQRIQRHPYLAIFDGADPSASTAVRTTSTTPLQALFLLNDKFVHEQSQAFAARILSAATNEASRLDRSYRLALARPATKSELEAGAKFLESVRAKLRTDGTSPDKLEAESWQAFARVMFRLNEFVYLD